MEVFKLAVVFGVMVASLKFKRPLWQSVFFSIIATALLFGIDIAAGGRLLVAATVSWQTISVILILYAITFLQRMLERRGQLRRAESDLSGIFNSRRISVTLAPVFIGLLPSAAAAVICGDIVNETCRDDLDTPTKAFVTTYFRHIPESFLPTYSSVIIMSQLCGVPIPAFMLGMLPLVAVMFALGYLFYVKRMPKETGRPPSGNKLKSAYDLIMHLWTLILIIILAFVIPVIAAVGIVCVLAVFAYRFKPSEILPLFKNAFEPRLIINTYLIMVFKEFITHTGVISLLPEFFSLLPIPAFLIFSLLFFFGTIVSGSTAIIATCTIMAFSAIPGSGMPLMVLLMSFSYAAMQISPTHVCLSVVADYYKISLGDIIKKTIPVISIFCVIAVVYYIALT